MAKLDSTLVYGDLNVTKDLNIEGVAHVSTNLTVVDSISTTKFHDTNNTDSWLDIRDTSGNYHLKAHEGGMYFDAPVFYFREFSNAGQKITIDAGTATATTSFSAPVFYDLNDTAYYVNPNSDSNLYRGKFRANDQADNNYTLAALWTQNYNSGPTGIAFHISGNVGKLLEMRTNGILYWNNSEVLTTSSGYLPLSGGTLTGDITVGSGQTSSNIYMADSNGTARRIHTNGNRIGFLNSSNSWGAYCSNNGDWTTDFVSYAGESMRAPIFYDSNDTDYFINPASTSNLNSIRLVSHLSVGGHSDAAPSNLSTSGRITFGSLSTDALGNYSIGTTLENYGGNYNKLDLAFHTGIRLGAHPNYGGVRFYTDQSMTTEIFAVGKSGNFVQAAYSMRAPIFYDSNDTNYNLNPASDSTINGLYVQGLSEFNSNSHFEYNVNIAGTLTGYLGRISHLGLSRDPEASTSSYKLAMGGNIRMYNNGIDYASQLHFNDNVRFYDDGNDSYLNFKYGDSDFGGIRVWNGGGTLKGTLYGSSSGFGLLDNDGAWAVRTQTGTNPLELRCDNNIEFQVYNSYTASPGSSRAPLFYDLNNTGYYTNPAGTSIVQRVTHINHTTPILIKVNSGYKSWVHHVSSSSSYHFAPSATNGGEDWDWSNQMFISTGGVVTANNFVLASDKRSKTKIEDLTGNNVDISWKSFEMKGNEGEYRTGVIAQELEENHPEFVNTDEKGFKSVKYIDLLIAKIAELEARLEKLEK